MTLKTPLHVQLYSEMLHRISAGVWPTGSQVPSEKLLVAEFGTSRGPVRQALASLRAEGLITGGRGAPPRVQRQVPSQSFGTFLSFTEWAKSAGFTPGQRLIEAARRPATEAVAQGLGIEVGDFAVELVRLRTLNDEPAMLERTYFAYPIAERMLTADVGSGSIYQQLARFGIVPTRARHVIDAVAAHPIDADWLGVVPGSPLLRVRRVSTADDNSIIECADDQYLPNAMTFAIENSTTHHTQLSREPAEASHTSKETT